MTDNEKAAGGMTLDTADLRRRAIDAHPGQICVDTEDVVRLCRSHDVREGAERLAEHWRAQAETLARENEHWRFQAESFARENECLRAWSARVRAAVATGPVGWDGNGRPVVGE